MARASLAAMGERGVSPPAGLTCRRRMVDMRCLQAVRPASQGAYLRPTRVWAGGFCFPKHSSSYTRRPSSPWGWMSILFSSLEGLYFGCTLGRHHIYLGTQAVPIDLFFKLPYAHPGGGVGWHLISLKITIG